MGTIKDVVDLISNITENAKDRKFVGELRQIQTMISNIQSEQASLYEKNIKLLEENTELKKVLQVSKERISTLELLVKTEKSEESISLKKLSDEAEKILTFIIDHEDYTAKQISNNLSFNFTRTEYWLQYLEENQMIYGSYGLGSAATYSIAQDGRKYLIENNII